MAAEKELIRNEADGSLSFGNHSLSEKAKLEGFPHDGGSYKVKTFKEITKLERDGEFVYESVPGTTVSGMVIKPGDIRFEAEGDEDAQITLGVEEDTEYDVMVSGQSIGTIKTNLSGKLSFSVELNGAGKVPVEIKKL